ncbi:MAG TPA: SpoIID/LytB domain-containing protein, partial [Thermoanaerobaculia bacterium]|nr:SpoIID/LytB domain-containing protein [Thermoanaerobaculia bacterium]
PAVPVLLKVGVASDLANLTLPCCEGEVVAESAQGEQRWAISSPLRVEPSAGIVESGSYRIQVAALRDERQAQELARRLERQTGESGAAHFDASVDLYRVRVGRYPTREAAEAALRRITARGLAGAFVVSEGGRVADPALRMTQGGRTVTIPGRWLAFQSAARSGLRHEGRRYRGRLLVYLNDRGTLNLINEVSLEDYLRGVVPSEMGPEAYPQLEGLKAQAVAARTYALRTLGEFAREGYDICATPRCQVYKGMEVEHPLSDRAIADTAGQVLLWEGRLVDALYSSTCGGHTEDGHVIFPLKQEPYLKGVPCVEAGMARLPGDLPPGAEFPAGFTLRLLPPSPEVQPAAALAARLEHLALLAGLPVPRERLASLDRREVQRFLAALFDLAPETRLFVAAADVPYLLQAAPAGWSEEDQRRAAYLMKSGVLTGPLDHPLGQEEIERMLLVLAELLRVVRREEVSYLSVAPAAVTVRAGKEHKTYALPGRLATFRRVGDAATAGTLTLVPGDGLELYWQGETLVAVVQRIEREGVAFDRSSSYSSWTRFRTDSELAKSIETRLPGLGFREFEVLSRGVSGRVGKIRIHGKTGETAEVEGLAVRWTLDIPDTLFTARRLEPPGREAGWLFNGKGWGHGVGLCQIGAYGMAQRGHGYREILEHYYRGAELGRVKLVAAAGAAAGGR